MNQQTNSLHRIDVEQALMLDLLGQQPVMFHRAYRGITGSINAALWLSYAMSLRSKLISANQAAGTPQPETLWISISRKDCEDGTGLTRHEQDKARRDLRAAGLLAEKLRGTNEVAINTQRLGQLLLAQTHAEWGDAIDVPSLNEHANASPALPSPTGDDAL
jgi:hypothetical protein